jgi:PleD family two-component response regulator
MLAPAGSEVHYTIDPLEALLMARHRPGLIHLPLFEVVMPGMDERELAWSVRSNAERETEETRG